MTTREPPEKRASAHGADAMRIGLYVFAVLAVLTVIEYVIAVSLDMNLAILMAIAVAKAALILYYFMHVVRAWTGSGEGE